MFCLRRSIMKLIFGSAFLLGRPLFGAVSDVDIDQYFYYLTRANSYSPIEHAGSHGTIGWGLGAGISSHQTPTNEELMREHWRGRHQDLSSVGSTPRLVLIPRIHIHKGLPWSIDVGGAFGQEPSTKATLISGYGQWTFFEAFALPAFALRASYSRLMALATTDASNLAFEGVASYGFLRLMTIYGAIGAQRDQIRVRSGSGYGTMLSLGDHESTSVQRILVGQTRAIGMQFQVLPPFWVLATEAKASTKGELSYLAKLSLGM